MKVMFPFQTHDVNWPTCLCLSFLDVQMSAELNLIIQKLQQGVCVCVCVSFHRYPRSENDWWKALTV